MRAPYPFRPYGFHEKALSVKGRRGDPDRPQRTLTTFAPLMLASIRTPWGRFRDDPVRDEFRPDTGAAI